MKLCRFGNAGDEKPGAIDADGRIRDLSGVIADLGPAELAPERLRALAAIDLATLPLVAATERLGPPITGPRPAERRAGQECVSTGRSRVWPYPLNKRERSGCKAGAT